MKLSKLSSPQAREGLKKYNMDEKIPTSKMLLAEGSEVLSENNLTEKTHKPKMFQSQRSEGLTKSNAGEKTPKLFVPKETEMLQDQVAGYGVFHSKGNTTRRFLQHRDGSIFKALQEPPRGLRELKFYKEVFDQETTNKDVIALREFTPCFLGEYHLEDDPEGLTKEISSKHVTYIKLENIISKFHKPCVMDVKIGRITYDPEATPEKIHHTFSVTPYQWTLGFGIHGMQVYSILQKKTIFYNRSSVVLLNEDEILSKGLGIFFNINGTLRRDIIQVILEKVRVIEKWFLTQRTFLFFSSSLLIVYEGDVDQDSNVSCNPHFRCPDLSFTDNMGQSVGDRGNGGGSIKYRNDDSVKKTSRSAIYKRTNKSTGLDKMIKGIPAEDEKKTHLCRHLKADVRMIDFQHVFPTKSPDDNYLYGLRNLIEYLEKLLKRTSL